MYTKAILCAQTEIVTNGNCILDKCLKVQLFLQVFDSSLKLGEFRCGLCLVAGLNLTDVSLVLTLNGCYLGLRYLQETQGDTTMLYTSHAELCDRPVMLHMCSEWPYL